MDHSPPETGHTAVSSLQAHTGYWLRFVSNHVSDGFRRQVEAQGVTVSEWVVLRALYDEGCNSAAALVQALGLGKAAVSKLLDRLLAKHLVSRSVHEQDRRQHILALTPAGRALVPVLARLADQNDAAFFDPLPVEQRAALLATLQDLVRKHGLKASPID